LQPNVAKVEISFSKLRKNNFLFTAFCYKIFKIIVHKNIHVVFALQCGKNKSFFATFCCRIMLVMAGKSVIAVDRVMLFVYSSVNHALWIVLL